MKYRFPIALVAVVGISFAIGWLVFGGGSSPPRHPGPPVQQVASVARPTRHRLPPGWSYLAKSREPQLVLYSSPHGQRSLTLTNDVSAGVPLTLLVRKRQGTWIQVYLPVRPNGGTGWVPAGSVKLLTTAYELDVQLGSHRLLVLASGHPVRRFSIGVGQSVTPTPTGTYFITELLKQPDPTGPYGPYAFGLSAHSGVLAHFGLGGDGQIGIHGTDEPDLVGTDVSHGCIRLRNTDILWLTKRLPLGTPVSIDRN